MNGKKTGNGKGGMKDLLWRQENLSTEIKNQKRVLSVG